MARANAPNRVRGAASGRRRRFAPSLFAQVFGLLVGILVGAQVVNIGILYLLPPPPPEFYRAPEVVQALKAAGAPVQTSGGRTLRAVVTNAPPKDTRSRSPGFSNRLRNEIALQMNLPLEQVRLNLTENQRPRRQPAAPPGPGASTSPSALPPHPAAQTPPTLASRAAAASDRARFAEHFVVVPFVAAVELPDGRWSVITEKDNGLFSNWQRRVLLWFGLCVLAVAPAAYLFARSLAAPIAAFARGAERLGRDPGAPPLDIRGPVEIDTAVGAFNDMQDRLGRYVRDRTDTVGAIAHDLRTPLTRLRFRAETLPDSLRGRMSADIDEMEAMIAATLAFVRDGSRQAPYSRLELSSLVSTVADEMSDTGLDVTADMAGGSIVVDGDMIALRRLTANLLDNAVKFAGAAQVRVYAEDGCAVIEVDDDGPGIRDQEIEAVFEPFRRGEPSRSRETGGAGLGLAVVRSIARAHGGEATLENRSGGGLRARARLPLSPAHA
jgi:signal transduction histidine kinase